MIRAIVCALSYVLLAGCSYRDVLPVAVPDGGSLARCSQGQAQVAGSVVSAGGRIDTCQCVTAGAFPGDMTIKLPGCEVHFGPAGI